MISTFGEERWEELARERALPSAQAQGCEIVIGHDPEGTASSSRNDLVHDAQGDYLCFLDADDELAPGYLDAMKRAYEREVPRSPSPLLLTPAVKREGRRRNAATLIPETSLIHANWLVISTLVPKDLFLEVGGFPEYPIYEDWALMCKLAQAGAEVVKVPEAVLIVHEAKVGGRNEAGDTWERREWHWKIGNDLWPDYYDQARYQQMMRGLSRRRRIRR